MPIASNGTYTYLYMCTRVQVCVGTCACACAGGEGGYFVSILFLPFIQIACQIIIG